LIDSTCGFFFRIGGIGKRSDSDEEARREVDDDGDDDDDGGMRDAGTDRGGDSVNGLSGVGRRDLSRM
jgi:hypothetical protein